jgi:hypothetical protein
MQKGAALADARGELEKQRTLLLAPFLSSSSSNDGEQQQQFRESGGGNIVIEDFLGQAQQGREALWNKLLHNTTHGSSGTGGGHGGESGVLSGTRKSPPTARSNTNKKKTTRKGASSGKRFKVNQKVLARYNGGMEWWRGRITNCTISSTG